MAYECIRISLLALCFTGSPSRTYRCCAAQGEHNESFGGCVKIQSTRLGLIVLTWLPALSWALPLNEYHAQRGDTLDLYVAGSSAQDNTLQRLFRLICEPNTLDVYRADGGNVRLFFCRTNSGPMALPGVAAGQKVAFHKSSIGGSGGGVGPLIQRTAVHFLNVLETRLNFDLRCPREKRTQHA